MFEAPSVPSGNPHNPASMAQPSYGMLMPSPQPISNVDYPQQGHRGNPNFEHPSCYPATGYAPPNQSATSYRGYDPSLPSAYQLSQMNGSSGLRITNHSQMQAYHPRSNATVVVPSPQQFTRPQYHAPAMNTAFQSNCLPSYQSNPIAPVMPGAHQYQGDGGLSITNPSMPCRCGQSSTQPLYRMTQPSLAYDQAPIINWTPIDGEMRLLNSDVQLATGSKRSYDSIAEADEQTKRTPMQTAYQQILSMQQPTQQPTVYQQTTTVSHSTPIAEMNIPQLTTSGYGTVAIQNRHNVVQSSQMAFQTIQKGAVSGGKQQQGIVLPSTQPAVAMAHYASVPINTPSQSRKPQQPAQPTQPVIAGSQNFKHPDILPAQAQGVHGDTRIAHPITAMTQKTCAPHQMHHQNNDGHAYVLPVKSAAYQAQAQYNTSLNRHQSNHVVAQATCPATGAVPRTHKPPTLPKLSQSESAKAQATRPAVEMAKKTSATEKPAVQGQQEIAALKPAKPTNESDKLTNVAQSMPQETQMIQPTSQLAQQPTLEAERLEISAKILAPVHDTPHEKETDSTDLLQESIREEYNAVEHLNISEEHTESVEWSNASLPAIARSTNTSNNVTLTIEANQNVELTETKPSIVGPDPQDDAPSPTDEEWLTILKTLDEEHGSGIDVSFGMDGFDWIGF
ncbi:hypothetical protein F5Y18DRAFT_427098 [Xylariaceae sp. FL1019]|nr:hypothetical protein F5Y18DRAFT_427098 [Xylariaceae sp. FL1019]